MPPFIPSIESDESVAYFDAEFTDVDVKKEAPSSVFDDEDPSDKWVREASTMNDNTLSGAVPMKSRGKGDKCSISGSAQDAFAGFSYSGDGESPFRGSSMSNLRITPADLH